MNIDNITKGEWKTLKISVLDFKQITITSSESKTVLAHMYLPEYDITPEIEANAELLAEAGTVANQCGLSPAQLLQQNKELREALEEIKTLYDNHQWDDDKCDLNSRIENMGTTAMETLSKHPNK